MSTYTYAPTLSQPGPTMTPSTAPTPPKMPNDDDAKLAMTIYESNHEYIFRKAYDFYWEYPEDAMAIMVTAGAIIVPRIAYWTGKKLLKPDQERNPGLYNTLETLKDISDTTYYRMRNEAYATSLNTGINMSRFFMMNKNPEVRLAGLFLVPSLIQTFSASMSARTDFLYSIVKTCDHGLKAMSYSTKAAIQGSYSLASSAISGISATKNTFVGFLYGRKEEKTKKPAAESSVTKHVKSTLALVIG